MENQYRFNHAYTDGVWLKDGIISIDEQGIITEIRGAQHQDCTIEQINGLVLPGVANCHSHAFQYAFAGLSEYQSNSEDSFWSWRNIMYQFVQKLTPEDLLVIAQKLYADMLCAGYTSVAEFHYLHHQADGTAYSNPALMSEILIEAAQNVGIGLTLLPVYYRFAGFNQKPAEQHQLRFTHEPEQYAELIDSLASIIKSKPNVGLGIAPHSLRAVGTQDINQAVAQIKALDNKAPIHIHIAEQQQEVDECLAATGMRPVEYLYDQCPVDESWCLIHATHLSNSEISQIAKSRAVVGLCPTTEANLGDGFFPAVEFLEQGGRIAIGSDSHISVNLVEELRLLEYGQRLKYQRRNLLADANLNSEGNGSVGSFLYQRAALGGAQAINRMSGQLTVGESADFVVLDEQQPLIKALMATGNSKQLLDSYVFANNQPSVKSVMVNGNWIDASAKAKNFAEPYFELLMRLLG